MNQQFTLYRSILMPLSSKQFYTRLSAYGSNRQKDYCNALIKGKTLSEIADKTGIQEKSIQRSLQRLRRKAADKGFDPDHDLIFPVSDAQNLSGASILYRFPKPNPKTGGPVIGWMKGQRDKDQVEQRVSDFVETFSEELAGVFKAPKREQLELPEHLRTFYFLGDPHLGMKALKLFTGEEDYDTDAAIKDIKDAMDILIERSMASHRGVLVNLGDMFHADNFKPFTPASGHLLDTDGNMSYTVDHAAMMFRYIVEELLKKHNEVEIINVRGNHDEYTALMFNKLIQMMFRDEPRVIIPNNENKFYICEFGTTFINIIHGDKIGNNAKWYQAITRMFPSEWGRCVHRYAHKGHIHHNTVEEIGGCTLESHNTLAAPDDYHHGAGYGAQRSACAITYDDRYGEVHRDKTTIALARSLNNPR